MACIRNVQSYSGFIVNNIILYIIIMSINYQTNQAVLCPDANYTVSAADSGKKMLIPAVAADRTYLLPNAQAGLHYRFLVKPAATLGNHVNLQPSLNGVVVNALINGSIIVIAAAAAGATVKYPNSDAVICLPAAISGDYCDLYCDGVKWHVSGMSSVVGFN